MHPHPHTVDALTVAGGFLLGLAGGAGHCSAMCGGFMIAMHRVRSAAPGSRLVDGLAFQAGRVVTYGGLTLLVGLVGAGLDHGGFAAARTLWMAALGALLLLFAAELLLPWELGIHRAAGRVGRWLGRLFGRFWRGGRGGLVVSGLAWGLIPCLFSWSAIVAAATRPPLMALAAIVAFGLGTMVPLAVVGGAAGAVGRAGRLAHVATAAALAVYGGHLVFKALPG